MRRKYVDFPVNHNRRLKGPVPGPCHGVNENNRQVHWQPIGLPWRISCRNHSHFCISEIPWIPALVLYHCPCRLLQIYEIDIPRAGITALASCTSCAHNSPVFESRGVMLLASALPMEFYPIRTCSIGNWRGWLDLLALEEERIDFDSKTSDPVLKKDEG